MRALNLLGVHLGPERALKPPGDPNPTGFWEHREINLINERLVDTLGGRLSPREPPPGWAASPALAAERDAAARLIADAFQGYELWGWKDTSNSLALAFWQRLAPEARYVVCFRNPLDVAASLERRGTVAADRALALWQTYMASALARTSGRPRLLVAYEDWHGDRRATAAGLARLAGLEPPAPGGEVDRRLERLVDADLRHHGSADADALADDRLAPDAASLHLAVRLLHATAPSSVEDAAAADRHALVDGYARRLLREGRRRQAAEAR